MFCVYRRFIDAGSGLEQAHIIQPVPHVASRRAASGRDVRRTRIMKTRAAVAFEAKRPLEIVEVDLEGPRAGEVLIEIKATGICHTDAYTLDGPVS